ncbi:MAG: cobM [Bacillota bacterium]|jgi:precorrin-4/cobalt-precorrin-4 C11-methyltransferase|nr:cobM [Bacillota bacterium]
MVHFVGAGSGAADLITVRGQKLLTEADVIIYAGSLVNPEHLEIAKPGCEIHDSASMTLEEVIEVMKRAEGGGKMTVRLHTGDPSIYGAIREQMDLLDEEGIHYDVVPGVSSAFGAAAVLKAEYTLPDVSQTVIITRMAGRTPVPEKEEISLLAAHQATMVIFLSTGLLEPLRERLLAGGYQKDTPAAIVYKATWPDEKVFRGTVDTLPQMAKENGITKTALILVGDFLGDSYERSKLYDPVFTHEFREASKNA